MENACLWIDTEAVFQNALQIQREAGPGRKLIPVLKGNAYGLGAVKIAEVLAKVPGVDTFAVSHAAEGLELRGAGFEQNILVMSLPLGFQLEEAASADLTLTLGAFHQFPLLKKTAEKLRRKIDVSLKVDTGLHRIGFEPSEAGRLCGTLKEAEGYLRIRGTFSHFSGDDPDVSAAQEEKLRLVLNALREAGIDPGICHIGSSASLEEGLGLDMDAVRVGRRLFLDSPRHPSGTIKEASALRTWLTDVRLRRAGEPVGYGGSFVPENDMRVGIISMGYGDGLDPALARAGAPVLVNGRRAAFIACCMDQSFVNLGDIPAGPGDEVTVFGWDREGNILPSQESAAIIGCEGCDLTSRLTPRVRRKYL